YRPCSIGASDLIAMRFRTALALVLFAMPALNACAGTPASGSAADRALAHGYLADPARGGMLSGSAQFLDAGAYVADRFRRSGSSRSVMPGRAWSTADNPSCA